MSSVELSKVIKHIRSALAKQDAGGLSDSELLKRYCQLRDETAFGVLVRRHGPMVMGVCRRVLRNWHDAEDAFQASFLVLVRKAPTLRSPGMLGNWLYGTAYRTALEARRATLKRRAKEATVVPKLEQPADGCTDLRDLLDHELERLPDKYRAAIVLCELEGVTQKEAARSLRVPEGTVASRLARGKALLAKRLAQRGLAVTSAGLGGVLSQNALANVPPSMVSSTIKAASLFAGPQAGAGMVSAQVANLTEGVLKTMLLSKLKIATAVLFTGCVLGVGAGAGVLARQTPTTEPVKAGSPTEQNRVGNTPPVRRVWEIKIFTLRNRKLFTADTAKTLEQLFADRIGKSLSIAPNPATRSILAQGYPDALDDVEAVIAGLEDRAADMRERDREVSAPATALGQAASKPTGLQIPKVPVAPSIVRVVNVNQEQKWIILEQLVRDVRDPARPKEYTEWLQFDLHHGQGYWADGSLIPDGVVWKLLPKSTAETARTVLLAADRRGLTPDYRNILKPDTIILIGETTLRGITEQPERQR